MGLRDMLHKKNRLGNDPTDAETLNRLTVGPEFTFIRSDTVSQEVIYPPGNPQQSEQHLSAGKDDGKARRSLDVFRSSRSRSASVSSQASNVSKKEGKRLSHRLHLSREPTSENVPANLPTIVTPDGAEDQEGAESQWEQRATILARENERVRSRPASPHPTDRMAAMSLDGPPSGHLSSAKIDENIQEAIRLHEEGDLGQSTRLFGRLADPNGANNPLSQVLYGLALRHGWGCAPNPEGAVTYLSKAASNAALVEQMALQAGLKKGGAAKGELVLAIFELANCFRHGWGVSKDAIAAKQYYETAANLGDSDAMNEVAWCYLEGFGCKKDKFAAARYYRLAEKNGNKTLGNSWIWKDKYGPPEEAPSSKK